MKRIPFLNNIKKRHILTLLVFVYFINGLIYIPQQSVTGDEADHLNYAVRFVKGHPEKIKPFDDASTMPVSAWNALPRAIAQKIHPGLVKNDGGVSDIVAGRYVTLFISFFIGFYLYKWTVALYGSKAAVIAVFLLVFCPNINAHAGLVTTDAYSVLFVVTTAYYFWRYLTLRSWPSLVLFSVSLGAAQLAKPSLTHLYFIFLLAIAVYLRRDGFFKNFKRKVVKLAVVVSVNLVILNAGFLGNGTGLPLKEYHFRSAFFNGVQSISKPISSYRLPLPKPYLEGLDLTKNIDEMGGGHPESSGKIYLLGKTREGSGFWYYYFVALFFKTPLTILLFSAIFCYRLFQKRFANFTVKEAVPLFLIFYFLIYFDFFYNSQVGIRHVLFIYPLLYVLLSPVIASLVSRKKRAALAGFICYTVATFYYYFPNLISYTNELIIPKRNAYRFLGDSNLDYKQGYYWMQHYMAQHKDVQLPGAVPRPGTYITTVNDYLNLDNESKNAWIQKFTPVGHVRHCNLLFNISVSDLKK